MATEDRRDDQTWVTIELTRAGENALEEGTLGARLRANLGVSEDWPMFMPAATYIREGRRITLHLLEGYVFVGSGLPETTYFAMETQSPVVRQILSSPGHRGIRVLSTLPNSAVEGMRNQLREQIATDITVGMAVQITEGTFSPLEGRVLYVEEEDAHVLIELRSIRIIKQLPRVFLEPIDKG